VIESEVSEIDSGTEHRLNRKEREQGGSMNDHNAVAVIHPLCLAVFFAEDSTVAK
jgi:hypothetical protein